MRSLGLVGAVLLALAHLASALAWAYGRYAERSLDRPEQSAALAASRHAARLAPWSARREALTAWFEAEQGQADVADARYGRALRRAPADPLLWTEYAQALTRNDRFAALDVPIARAFALAPASPAVQGAHASLAVSYWERVSPEVRAFWLRALQYELRRGREPFLDAVIARGRLAEFCDGPGQQLGVRRWCATARATAARCEKHYVTAADLVLCMATR